MVTKCLFVVDLVLRFLSNLCYLQRPVARERFYDFLSQYLLDILVSNSSAALLYALLSIKVRVLYMYTRNLKIY